MKRYFKNEYGGALVYVLLIIFSLAIFMPVVFSQLSQDRSQVMRLTNEVQVNQVLNTAMNSYLENNEILQSLCDNETLYLPNQEAINLEVSTKTLNDVDLSCQQGNGSYKVVMTASSGEYSETLTHMVTNKRLPPWIYVENLGDDTYLISGFTPKGTTNIKFDIQDVDATQTENWDGVSSFTMLSDEDIKSRLEMTDIGITDAGEQEELLASLKKSFGSYLFFLNYHYGQNFNIEYSNANGEVSFKDFKPYFNFYAFTKVYSATNDKVIGGMSHYSNGDISDRMTSLLSVSAANGDSVIRIGPDGEIEYIEMENEIVKPADETLIVTNSVDFTNTDKEDINLSAGEVVIQDLASLTVENQSNPTLNITSQTGDVVIQGSLSNHSTSNSNQDFNGITVQSAQDIDAREATLYVERRIEFDAGGSIYLQDALMEFDKKNSELNLYAEDNIFLDRFSVQGSPSTFNFSGDACGILESGNLDNQSDFGDC